MRKAKYKIFRADSASVTEVSRDDWAPAVAIEVGMQKGGLGIVLANLHLPAGPFVALPSSLFSVVHKPTSHSRPRCGARSHQASRGPRHSPSC